jgi:hypothetical protein
MRRNLALISTILGVALSVVSAFGMRDHVRLVEIVGLFFGGFGSGAGVARLVSTRGIRPTAA